MILAHTVKGWTIEALEGKNATHQMKKLNAPALKQFRDRLELPISDKEIDDAYEADGSAPFYHPGEGSDVLEYLRDRRRELGGPVPERKITAKPLKLPGDEMYAELKQGSGKQSIATTMAFVRLLKDLMKDPEIGERIVPIAPDEYRTFGMDSMFSKNMIYNPHGQSYEAVDRKQLMAYKESTHGQLLHEGISEAGSMASATAAGSTYATHGLHMIPFYIFYSMFGFQRTGDSIWAMTDQLARGFLIGATAGRTTLTGEGLQHADGHSPLLAATNPAVVHYDPALAYEVSYIVQDGLRRMYGSTDEHPHGEDVVYYVTVYNEPYVHPAEPENLDVEGLLKGIYHVATPPSGLADDAPRVQLLASGVGFPWIQKAQQLLADEWGVAADIWSVTSWNELARDAVAAEEWNLLHPGSEPRTAYVADKLRARRRPGRGGLGLHGGGPAADRPLGAARLPGARHRRLRLRRHPPRRAPVLPRGRRVGRRPGPPGPGRRRRRPAGRGHQGVRGLPHRRPDRRPRREAGGRGRLSSGLEHESLRDLLDQTERSVVERASRQRACRDLGARQRADRVLARLGTRLVGVSPAAQVRRATPRRRTTRAGWCG